MAERRHLLVLYARRVPSTRGVVVETLAGLAGVTRRNALTRWSGALATLLDRNSYTALSYVNDWLEAFDSAVGTDAHLLNIVDARDLLHAYREIPRAALIVVLHSALGDDTDVLQRLCGRLQNRSGRLLLFIGNEYTLMREKIAFARATAADYIASQLPPKAAAWLYAQCDGAVLLHMPAALNPARFALQNVNRDIDLGFRGDLYPLFIGDDERTRVLAYFREHGQRLGLHVDIEFRREPAADWCRFLNRCKGIVGGESGTYYLERENRTEAAVRAFVAANPTAPFSEIERKFFASRGNAMSGKAISSRHFEAIGTKTCQLLLEGEYNGILTAGQHFIAIRKDLSNLEDCLREFRDPARRLAIAENAYQHVLSSHTYAHRVEVVMRRVGSDGVEWRAGARGQSNE